MSAAAPAPEKPIAEDPQPSTNDAPRTRAETNRANAQHSTGPRTAEGKSRSSQNAFKHGLFAAEVVLPGENREAFDEYTSAFSKARHAETDEELALAEEVINCRWRARRLARRETALILLTTEQERARVEQLFEGDHDSITPLAQAAGFQANARLFNQMWLAEARLDRRADRTEDKLLELVKTRRNQSEEHTEHPAQKAAEPEYGEAVQSEPAQPEPDAAQAADFGFVPPISQQPAYPPNMPRFSGPAKKENRRKWLRKHGFTAQTTAQAQGA